MLLYGMAPSLKICAIYIKSQGVFCAILTLAFGIMAYAKDAVYTETDEVVGISNITELKEAGTNASIDSTDPTVIELVADISTGDRFDIAGTANDKKYVTLKGDYELSLTGRKEFYGKNAFVRIEKAEVVIEDVYHIQK